MGKNNLTYHIKLLHTFNLLYKNEMIEAENIFIHLNLIVFNDKKMNIISWNCFYIH